MDTISILDLFKIFGVVLYFPNNKVSYLAEHAKKKRVRKKNINRILKNTNKKTIKEMKACLSKNGRHYVKSVHRLVAEAFIPNPYDLPVINHINEDKQDNRVENLEWCTVQHNTMHGTGRIRTAMKQGRAVIQLDMHDNVIDEFYSMGVASKTTGIPQPNIFKVCNGERNTAGGYKWRYKDDQD